MRKKISWKVGICIVGGIMAIVGTLLAIGAPLLADGIRMQIKTSKDTLNAVHRIEVTQAVLNEQMDRLENGDDRQP